MTTEKKAQVLQLDPPHELIFKGPFSDVITANLVLHNPSNKTVLFKVKTTAPKQYCVRPNSGILEPGKEQTIAVMLQPSLDLSSVDKSKHKFMVQSMFAPPDYATDNLDQLWRAVPKTELMDSKLKCSFIEDQSSQQADKSTSEQQPATSSEGLEEVTSSEGGKDDLFTSIIAPQQNQQEEEPVKLPVKPSVGSGTQPTAGSTPAHVPTSKEIEIEHAQLQSKMRTLQDKLDHMMTENKELKGEASKLRQRVTSKPAAVTSHNFQSSPSPAPSSPLNIIAVLLILVALVLGYLVGRWL